MASEVPDVVMQQSQAEAVMTAPTANGKRKRDEADDGEGEQSLFIPDEDKLVPENNDQDGADEGYNDDQDENSEDDASDAAIDGEAITQPHNEKMEAFPDHAIYDADIKSITDRLTEIPRSMAAILKPYDGDSKHMLHKTNMAKYLQSPPRHKKWRIALLGDAGAGKSSVLNSLTDIQDLAKSMSSGQSCTTVATEYRGALPGQLKDFAASVQYFDITQIQKMMQKLLEDYNLFAFEFDRDWDDDMRATNKRAMTGALKTFQVLFCDMPEFRTKTASVDYLKKAYTASVADNCEILRVLVASCKEKLMAKTVTQGNHSEYCEASSRAKLREMVDPLMSSKTGSDIPALWPLIKQVIVGIRGSRILEGVTIVDLPGISDTNVVRVEHCTNYIKSCNMLWVVAPISRVVDDAMVYHLLDRYAKSFHGSVAVVCTHADADVSTKLARHLEEEDIDVKPYFDLGHECKALKASYTTLSKRAKVMRNHKTQSKQKLLEIKSKEDEAAAIMSQWRAKEAERFAFLVKTRNDDITKHLREEMREHLPEGQELTVYCVSNHHYAGLKGAGVVRGPKLSAEATGIPGLRAYALSLAAPRLLREFEDYRLYDIAELLSDAGLWVNVTQIERRKDLLEIVKEPQLVLAKHLERRADEYRVCVDLAITESLRISHEKIIETAKKAFIKKLEKHAGTQRAFIRRDGNHSTKICPKESWNEHFSKGVTDIVKDSWPQLETCLAEANEKLQKQVVADLRMVLTTLGSKRIVPHA